MVRVASPSRCLAFCRGSAQGTTAPQQARNPERAWLRLTAPETLSDDVPYDRTDDRAGREIREPMDGHGDADADIERIGDRHRP